MPHVLARCTLRAATGLPRDDCINSFYFETIANTEETNTIIGDLLSEFYSLVTSSGNSVSSYINDTIIRTEGLFIELIDDPETPPNVPFAQAAFDLEPTSATPLPQEVACCLTYTTVDYLTASNPGRHRGRVYIGPLSVDAGSDSGVMWPSRPNSTFRDTLRAAATRMLDDSALTEVIWVMWSRSDGLFPQIGGGWVDNEWDTQRRRGQQATMREYWPIS